MPVVLDLGFTAALDNLVFYFQKNFGLKISVTYKIEANKINHSLKVTLYRIVQDLFKLTESKTSTKAINITLKNEPGLFRIKAELGKIKDAGNKIEFQKHNPEMKYIYQRVHLFRGKIKWSKIPTDKTGILIEIPLDD